MGQLGAKIQQVRKFIIKYQKEDETVSHIDSADVEKVSKAVTDVGNWFDNSMNQINGLKKDQDPPIFTANFKSQYDSLVSTVDKIMNTPKPTPPPPAPEEEKKTEEEKKSEDKTEAE